MKTRYIVLFIFVMFGSFFYYHLLKLIRGNKDWLLILRSPPVGG